jgi:hypothetical protein
MDFRTAEHDAPGIVGGARQRWIFRPALRLPNAQSPAQRPRSKSNYRNHRYSDHTRVRPIQTCISEYLARDVVVLTW